MPLDENTYHEIDRFLRGEMSGKEVMFFATRIEADKELQAETEWMHNMKTAMKDSGRKVLRAQIAMAMSGVPAAAISNYVPSKNRISFFKKWWWVFAITAIVVAAAAIWFFIPPHHENVTEGETLNDRMDQPAAPGVISDTSCMDSAAANAFAPSLPPDSVSGCLTRIVRLIPSQQFMERSDEDTSRNRIALSSSSNLYSLNSGLSVSFCPKNKIQEYTFGNSLQLYCDYTDTTGLRFYQSSASIILADRNGNAWVFDKTDSRKPFIQSGKNNIHHSGGSKPKDMNK